MFVKTNKAASYLSAVVAGHVDMFTSVRCVIHAGNTTFLQKMSHFSQNSLITFFVLLFFFF